MVTNEQDILDIKTGGKHLVAILKAVADLVRPGTNLLALESLANQLAEQVGGTPSFKGYQGYPAALCLSVNHVIVHGIPRDYVLKSGDLVGIDMGLLFKGWHTDAAVTLPVGEISPEVHRLLSGTYQALLAGTDAAKAGNRVADISQAIESTLHAQNLTIFRSLVGHGVGRALHEEPMIPNFHTGNTGSILKSGMTLALEPITGLGQEEMVEHVDGWTLETADGKLAAHYEHTLLITPEGPIVITPLDELVDFLKKP